MRAACMKLAFHHECDGQALRIRETARLPHRYSLEHRNPELEKPAMSDLIDLANENVEINLSAAIESCRRAPALPPKGACWFCEEPLGSAQKFCDGDCASDYEREQSAIRRAGRTGVHDTHSG